MAKQQKAKKPLHPEGCARDLPAALRLIKLYTGGSFDVYMLSESQYTAQRADIMRHYCGKDVPFSECTSGRMLGTFAEHANDHGANPEVESNSQLVKWLKAQAGEPDSEPTEASAEDRVADLISATAGGIPAIEAADVPDHPSLSGETKMATKTKKKAAGKKPVGKKAAGKPSKKASAPKAAKEPKVKKPKAEKPAKERKVTLIDAAAQVLAKEATPMTIRGMVEKVIAGNLWVGKAKEPHQSLSGAVQREITAKGKESRFKKTGRGLFEHTGIW